MGKLANYLLLPSNLLPTYLMSLPTTRPRPSALRNLIGSQFQLGHDLLQVRLQFLVLSRLEQVLFFQALDYIGRRGVQTVKLKTDRLLFRHQAALDGAVAVDCVDYETVPDRRAFPTFRRFRIGASRRRMVLGMDFVSASTVQ